MATSRVDPHVKILDDRVYHRAIELNLDAIVYAPHFTPWPEIVERAEYYTDEQLTVVPGREIFTGTWRRRKHVLALGLDEPIPDFISLESAMDALREQDACVIIPHPGYLTMSLPAEDVQTYREVIDAVEVFNPRFLPWHAPRARSIATNVQRTPIVSSYAHLVSTVGVASVTLDRSVSSPDAVIDSIRAGAISELEVPPWGRRWRHGAGELADLVHENTIAKLRRVRGSDIEATHPEAPLYNGRFDIDDG